jgi:hypothetical protein
MYDTNKMLSLVEINDNGRKPVSTRPLNDCLLFASLSCLSFGLHFLER